MLDSQSCEGCNVERLSTVSKQGRRVVGESSVRLLISMKQIQSRADCFSEDDVRGRIWAVDRAGSWNL